MRIDMGGNRALVRLELGEEIVASLMGLARQGGIGFAEITGIGAVSAATLAFYDLELRGYREKRFDEPLEMASLIGNISWFDNEPVVHVHCVFSRRDGTALGGHLMSATVSATAELMLRTREERVIRSPDERIGLNLLDLS